MTQKEITVLMVEPGKPIYPEYLSQMFTKLQKHLSLPVNGRKGG